MLAPGQTIGILGGGQLGRMMALAAARLGLKCHIYCPDAASPAFEVAATHTIAAYDDEAALARFADSVDVVTYEFENVPGETAAFLEARRPVRPGPKALAVSQDRLVEKRFIADLGIAVAPFAEVTGEATLESALARFKGRGVLKTRRFGYDGKGQVMLRSANDVVGALARIANAPAILEGLVDFEREVSIIVARGLDGTVEAFDLAWNTHAHHILDRTRVPAGVSPETEAEARRIGETIAAALDYVGVLAVELFLVRDGAGEHLVVNEIAPRVHNSGHWTEDACLVSQFEQHVRAVAGWPLGEPTRLADVEMENLVGADADRWAEIAAEPGARLHLYGKAESRPGRKMGHVNRLKLG
ncbi:MAG TPA: 5-(carboxyamino)imidazole ribonucleotide synthase [Kaistiaceae bacterium]|nr:5-(carboxyamino)imidazole ribonucleotide synthase [Kaistiaceae bacterium]